MLGKFFKNPAQENDKDSKASDRQHAAAPFLARLDQAAIVTGADGIVQYMNEAATKITGWSSIEGVGRSISNVMQLTGYANGQHIISQLNKVLVKGMARPLGVNIMLLRTDATQIAVEGSIAPVHDMDNRISGTLVLLQDVTKLRKITDSLAHEARHDVLTGLVNRREFRTRLEAAYAGSCKRNESHALCYLDLDQFKVINDTCGHAAGDDLLRKVTELLKSLLHSDETLARLGGDEFGLLIQNSGLDEAVRFAENMLSAIQAFRFYWEGKTYSIGVSIGVTLITRKSKDVTTIVSIADAACYAAKENGRNRVHAFNPNDMERDQCQQDTRILSNITSALDENRFVLYYQPIIPVCASHDDCQYGEILVRMINADGVLVQPAQFIPAAERNNLMPALDRWIIERVFDTFHKCYPTRALKQAHQWSVNISGSSLSSEGFVAFIRDQSARYEIVPQSICFEITESAAIIDIQCVSDFLWGLRLDGFLFALDDFGIGISSFSYLKGLPIDYIKIDGELVKNILDDKVSLAMTEAITRVCGAMDIQIVAEYVENNAILEKLREIGVGYAQGYGVSEPIPLGKIDKAAGVNLPVDYSCPFPDLFENATRHHIKRVVLSGQQPRLTGPRGGQLLL